MPLYPNSPSVSALTVTGAATLSGIPMIIMGTTSATQLTVAASGLSTASALPLFPAAYAKIQNSTGSSLVFPLYAAS